MIWTQTSHCVNCSKLIHRVLKASDVLMAPYITMSYYVPQLCDECLANGWRFDIGGGIINEYDEPEVSLLDLLTNEENK